MKVLFVETSASGVAGGSYFSLLEQVRSLDKARYQPLVLIQHPHHLIEEYRQAGVRVFVHQTHLSRSASTPPRQSGPLKTLLWRIIGLTGQRNVETLRHARNSSNRRPRTEDQRGHAAIEKRRLRRVAAVICISRAVERNFRVHFPGFACVSTVHNPVSSGARPATRRDGVLREWGIFLDTRLLVQVSNNIFWKGRDAAIEAMKTL
jgi:hypothetical protein